MSMRSLKLAFVVALVSLPTFAANLVTNGTFNTGVTGWNLESGAVTTAWQALDGLQVPTSGSIKVTTVNTIANGTGTGANQCVRVTPGSRYDAGARVMIPGQPITSAVSVGLYYFTSIDCTGSLTGGWGTSSAVTQSNGEFTPVATRDQLIPSNVNSVKVMLYIQNDAVGTTTAYFDDVFFGPTGGCVPDEFMVCLDGARYAVFGSFATPSSPGFEAAHVVQLTADTAYMWFFNRANVEVTLKVLNGCGVNSKHWVFLSGLTNVNVVTVVTDTQTGVSKEYRNPLNQPFEVNLDTSAFECP